MINQIPPSRIRNLNELEREIKLVKFRLKAHEADLQDRWKRLPEESIKATLGAVIPFFLRQKVASNTWSFIKVISNLLFSSSKTAAVTAGSGWKDILLGNAKKWGILAGVQGVLKMIKNRKKEN